VSRTRLLRKEILTVSSLPCSASHSLQPSAVTGQLRLWRPTRLYPANQRGRLSSGAVMNLSSSRHGWPLNLGDKTWWRCVDWEALGAGAQLVLRTRWPACQSNCKAHYLALARRPLGYQATTGSAAFSFLGPLVLLAGALSYASSCNNDDARFPIPQAPAVFLSLAQSYSQLGRGPHNRGKGTVPLVSLTAAGFLLLATSRFQADEKASQLALAPRGYIHR
jgi:hypothetical protein